MCLLELSMFLVFWAISIFSHSNSKLSAVSSLSLGSTSRYSAYSSISCRLALDKSSLRALLTYRLVLMVSMTLNSSSIISLAFSKLLCLRLFLQQRILSGIRSAKYKQELKYNVGCSSVGSFRISLSLLCPFDLALKSRVAM